MWEDDDLHGQMIERSGSGNQLYSWSFELEWKIWT
ncbi:hypothetical protein NK6_2553 [Bradyrhizobium diazoefficiens]|uniref:Uncharacterized protein n=1 Tax=Bradyrhizobium diazoefficiens TaxID=1355477 RepID=A0A0E4FSQ5_9BRAD|nr:hypothetical protein NK6_2553 [Bradyrhizobium diazoefficiens]